MHFWETNLKILFPWNPFLTSFWNHWFSQSVAPARSTLKCIHHYFCGNIWSTSCFDCHHSHWLAAHIFHEYLCNLIVLFFPRLFSIYFSWRLDQNYTMGRLRVCDVRIWSTSISSAAHSPGCSLSSEPLVTANNFPTIAAFIDQYEFRSRNILYKEI